MGFYKDDFSRELIGISEIFVPLLACFSNFVYCFYIRIVFGRDQSDFLPQFAHP